MRQLVGVEDRADAHDLRPGTLIITGTAPSASGRAARFVHACESLLDVETFAELQKLAGG